MDGFWSLTLYDMEHFFAPNDLKRYSLGAKNWTLVANVDRSLAIYVGPIRRLKAQRANWLPAPKDAAFSRYFRAYWLVGEEALAGLAAEVARVAHLLQERARAVLRIVEAV